MWQFPNTWRHQTWTSLNLKWDQCWHLCACEHTLIVRFMGPTWGTSGADRTQVGPMLAPWTLLFGITQVFTIVHSITYRKIDHKNVHKQVCHISENDLKPGSVTPPLTLFLPILSKFGKVDNNKNIKRARWSISPGSYLLDRHLKIGPWKIWMKFKISSSQANFCDLWLRYLLWNYYQMNVALVISQR